VKFNGQKQTYHTSAAWHGQRSVHVENAGQPSPIFPPSCERHLSVIRWRGAKGPGWQLPRHRRMHTLPVHTLLLAPFLSLASWEFSGSHIILIHTPAHTYNTHLSTCGLPQFNLFSVFPPPSTGVGIDFRFEAFLEFLRAALHIRTAPRLVAAHSKPLPAPKTPPFTPPTCWPSLCKPFPGLGKLAPRQRTHLTPPGQAGSPLM